MEKRKFGNKRWKIWLTAIVGIIAMISVICIIYVNDYYRADEDAKQALLSDEAVKVEYTAYAPLLHELAEREFFVCCAGCPVIWRFFPRMQQRGYRRIFQG